MPSAPLYPGEDFEAVRYDESAVVVDNPPFSILAYIIRFYTSRHIRFFLFAPALTLFAAPECKITYIPCGVQIIYENGADVATSFCTNLDTCAVRTAPTLYSAVNRANAEAQKARKTPRERALLGMEPIRDPRQTTLFDVVSELDTGRSDL